ncbi:MAG: outer membrane beta-barrel protein [Ginsengibacter sp.]
MERRFFMNEFEQSLKEQADKFQMVPSKKVWHGIYNDLHPGKRWPSVTMSLLLIFTLVVIGHLNTNNSRRLAYMAEKTSEAKGLAIAVGKNTGPPGNIQRINIRRTDLDKGRELFVYSTGKPGSTTALTHEDLDAARDNNLRGDRTGPDNSKPADISGTSFFQKSFLLSRHPIANSINNSIAENENSRKAGLIKGVAINETTGVSSLKTQTGAEFVERELAVNILPVKKNSLNSKDLSNDKNNNEINSTKNTLTAEKKVVRFHKKRNDKIRWVFFAGPVVNNVSFGGKPLKATPNANFAPGLSANQKDYNVIHHSSLGMDAGIQMNYGLTKKLRFTTGMHLSYSGYNIVSNEVHPTFATLRLRDPETGITYSKSFITHYGDGTGQTIVMIHNHSWQLSIPVGLQYELGGNSKMQFNVAGNVEPSLILKSNAYIMSSDGNNYLNDPSLLRKWNLNSNFGAFVSFSSHKFKWQVGPNVRYQWMSTYKKDYTVKEHLIDYGIRIGVSR